jgi:hypothetical protein
VATDEDAPEKAPEMAPMELGMGLPGGGATPKDGPDGGGAKPKDGPDGGGMPMMGGKTGSAKVSIQKAVKKNRKRSILKA